jgi:signal transduction histidine kinase/CheY-like chemotaxis protein
MNPIFDSQPATSSSLSFDSGIFQQIEEETFRSLILATGALLLAWFMLANFNIGLGDVVSVSYVVLVAAVFSTAAYLLMHRSTAVARVVWLVGLSISIGLALAVFRRPEMLFFYALIPLLSAALTFHWQWGILAEAGLVPLLFFLEPAVGLPRQTAALFSSTDLVVLLMGGILLVLGSAFARALSSLTGWSIVHYRKAREELEEIRDERAGLLQIQEDFILANNELARLTDRLAAMAQVAEEARRTKEDFVARVSHELRTPLNMIIGFSEVIMKSPQLYGESIPSSLLADVDAILRNSHHLARLVDDILDLSQVEAGRMALTKEWVSPPELLDEAVSVVKGLVDSKGLYLRQEISERLPQMFCDSTRIRQVVINLLGNAVRFTEKGGIIIRARLDGNFLVISATDTGPGIAPADQKRVFEPFQQVDSVLRRHKGGTGLGLTISKQFVEMHGGRIWLESQVGVGSTFFFSLPVNTAIPELAEGPSRWFSPYFEYDPRTRPANLPAPVVRPRYVLVESEDNLQRLFTRYADNVEVVGMKRIEDAVSEVRRSPAQALILNQPVDLQDPELKSHLDGLPFGTPVIACWMPGREEAARRLGVVEYIVKPVTRQDLLSTLEKVPGVRKVLLVDDEPEILRLFVRMLSLMDRPLTLIQAINGQRALQLLRSRKPDLMLLDLVMPEMDGFQVIEEKNREPAIRDIPVVAVSSLNPRGENNVSRTFSVMRGSGLSARELLNCVQTISGILVPEDRTAGLKPVETPDETPVS